MTAELPAPINTLRDGIVRPPCFLCSINGTPLSQLTSQAVCNFIHLLQHRRPLLGPPVSPKILSVVLAASPEDANNPVHSTSLASNLRIQRQYRICSNEAGTEKSIWHL